MFSDVGVALCLTSPTLSVDIQDPASSPIYWVTKWVDYSDKYGLGYALCDGSVAVYFNDGTKLIVDASEK